MKNKRNVIISGLYIVSAAAGLGGTPDLINYQGRLTDEEGLPVTAQVSFSLHLFEVEAGGDPVYSEDIGEVGVLNGVYGFAFGTNAPTLKAVLRGSEVWLELVLDGSPLSPRQRLLAVPYALRSDETEHVGTNTTFAGGAVNGAALAINAVTGEKILDGSVTADDVEAATFSSIFWMLDGNAGTGEDTNFLGTTDSEPLRLRSAGGVQVSGGAGAPTITLSPESAGGGSAVTLSDGVRTTIELDAFGADGGGEVRIRNSLNGETFLIDGDSADDGQLILRDAQTNTAVVLHADSASSGPELSLRTDQGIETVVLVAQEGPTGGHIRLLNLAGQATITLDAEHGEGGAGRLVTDVLQITGGSDLSEQFDVKAEGESVKPGMVVCIDPDSPGRLTVSQDAYDRTVAGVISGAGGVRTGLLMGQRGSVAGGMFPVALSGRVWTLCDASRAPIRPGDMLTTSTAPGHAMKAADDTRARGATIGKAMTPLDSGRGLVLVLVTLQ